MVLKVLLKPKRGSGKLAKKVADEVDLEDDAVALTLFSEIAKSTGLSLDRIRLTVKPSEPETSHSKDAVVLKQKDHVLQQSELLKSLAKDGKLTIYYRDLGPQVSWTNVFIIEYLGPIMIHLAIMSQRQYVYGIEFLPTTVQSLTYLCVMLHFFKREYETVYVHKFSLSTMPLFNLFKNSAHYWLLSGVLVAYFCYAPESWWTGNAPGWKKFLFYCGGVWQNPDFLTSMPGVWLYAEISNLIVHRNLASLRAAGTAERRVPYGYGFGKVSCPNYFFEFLAWLSLTLMTGSWAMALFTFVGTLQMYFWAVKKHRRYLKEFPDYPKDRKAMFPFIA